MSTNRKKTLLSQRERGLQDRVIAKFAPRGDDVTHHLAAWIGLQRHHDSEVDVLVCKHEMEIRALKAEVKKLQGKSTRKSR